MKTNEVIQVAIAEQSVIIRSGLTSTLKRVANLKIQPVELLSAEALHDYLRTQYPHLLIVNPNFGEYFDVAQFREEHIGQNIRLVAIVSSLTDPALLSKFDASISVFDDIETISEKLHTLLASPLEEMNAENAESLSQREKEIVICIVKGLTNKEIAKQLFLSVHTVITHRRNISKKLQIHSAAGLTIYAIVNKLVSLEDVKDL